MLTQECPIKTHDDVKMALEQLGKAEVFRFHNGRDHKTVLKYLRNACTAVDQEALRSVRR